MGERYKRQIRKEINSCYSTAVKQVYTAIEAKMESANFFQRFRIAMRYLLKKSFMDFF